MPLKLEPKMMAVCSWCKTHKLPDWTTGNKSLDLFLMESWSNCNIKEAYDAYIELIEYSLLTNIQEMTTLCHGCTHIADWLEPITNNWIRVALKKIVDGQDAQLFDFYQVSYYYVK